MWVILLMKKKLNYKKIIKKLILICIIAYVFIILLNQQKTLNSYSKEKEYYASKVDELKEDNKTLTETKNNLDSKEYIETVAREKLDMYLPNEKVYKDITK